ncbi:MAG: ubiquinol-cytochrome c reductase iron-sulfur subunit [Chloroflexi bacterium]|nr:ubiquinol-cytochrome c reductase iron-sulfur subunit [Chloroflexota bacterium]
MRLEGLGETGSRRRFLANLSFGLGGLIGAMVGVPLIGYIFAPLIRPAPQSWQTVGPLSMFPLGQTIKADLPDPSSVAWAGLASRTAVYVRQSVQNQFDVWAVNCTHLGCPVNWLADAGLFECPCHGGIYYANGDVAAGPPPHPLFKYEVRLQGDQVQVLTAPLPTYA